MARAIVIHHNVFNVNMPETNAINLSILQFTEGNARLINRI